MINNQELSAKAREFREWVENPDNFLETCDGNDPGTPCNPSIWIMGIEPGWSSIDEQDAGNGGSDSYTIEWQLKRPYNRNAFKLLAALKGESPHDYASFALRKRPFEPGSKGYFKLNLFPQSCNNLGSWTEEYKDYTGFSEKRDYQIWMRAVRFPVLKTWIEKCRPGLIICTGLGSIDDFLTVTGTPTIPEAHYFEINGLFRRVHVTSSGTVPVAIVPHLSGGCYSLSTYESITRAAKYIRETLPSVR